MNNLFHLAFPVKNLEESRRFYGEILGCEEGRSSEQWIDFNLFGHQIVAHLAPELKEGDVVAIMSNGGFGGIHEKILNVLKGS